MRWKTEVCKYPEIGDKRVVKRFALLPVDLEDGFTIWLESYYEELEFQKVNYVPFEDWEKVRCFQKPKVLPDFKYTPPPPLPPFRRVKQIKNTRL